MNSDNEILYNINIYINNELYGTIEIPKLITTKLTTKVAGSKGSTKTLKAGEFEISGPSYFSMITADDTFIKDVYIHSGLRKSGVTINSHSYKAEYVDEIIAEEGFSSSNLESKIEFKNFDKASYERESSAMLLSYTGDGNSTGKDMLVSPSVCISGTSSAEMYYFKSRLYFNDFKLERKLAQLIFLKDGVEYEGMPLLKTALYPERISQSEMLITYFDENGDVVTHKSGVDYHKWYNVEIIIDLFGEYPVYIVSVTDDSGNKVMTAVAGVSEKTLKINALLENYSRVPVNGVVLACQYSLSGEMLSLSKCDFNATGAYMPFVVNSLPTSDALSIELNLNSDMSYIKLFVLNSLNNITLYTGIVKYVN